MPATQRKCIYGGLTLDVDRHYIGSVTVYNTPGKRHNNTWVEPLAGNCTISSTRQREHVWQKCKIQKELMHCHCGTNNRAPWWTFTDPCKPEARLGVREESASPAWLAAPAMNARDTTKVYIWRLDTGCGPTLYRKCHSYNTPGKRHNNTWVEPLAGNCTISSTRQREHVWQKCKIQKELMHCHCGTNNRAPWWTFTDPCKPEVRPDVG